MTAVESDIDRFIREQKAKLAQERDALVDDSRSRGEGPRRKWDKSEGSVAKLAEQGPCCFVQLPVTASPQFEMPPPSPPPSKTGQFCGLPFGEYEEKQKKFREELRHDFQEYVARQNAHCQQQTDDQKAAGYDYNQVHRRLLEEKRKDYNDLLEKQDGRQGRPGRDGLNEIESPSIIPFDSNEAHAQKQRALKAERQREYNELMAKTGRPFRRGDAGTPPPEMMGLNVGQYEKTRQKLRNDLQREYREALEKQKEEKQKLLAKQHGLPTPEKDPAAGLSPRAPDLSPRAAAPPAGLSSRDLAPAYRRRSPDPSPTRPFQDNIFKQRNEPYKPEPPRQKPKTPEHQGLPIGNYNYEDKKRKLQEERHKEYVEMMQSKLDQDRELVRLQELNRRELELRKKLEEEKLMERLEQDRAELERLRIARKESAERHTREETLSQHPHVKLDELDRRVSALTSKLDHEKARAQDLRDRYDAQQHWSDYVPKELRSDQLAKAKATLDPPGQGPIGDGERRHRQALEDERRDFLQHLEKVRTEQPVRRGWEEPREEQGLPLGGYENRRKQLEEERHRDYLALQAQDTPATQPPRDAWDGEGRREQAPVSVGSYEDQRKRLQADRQREYQEFLEKESQGKQSRQDWKYPELAEQEQLFPLGGHEEKQKALKADLKKEYNEFLDKQSGKQSRRTWEVPEVASEEKGLPLGQYDYLRQEFNQARQREYNSLQLKREEEALKKKLGTEAPEGTLQQLQSHFEQFAPGRATRADGDRGRATQADGDRGRSLAESQKPDSRQPKSQGHGGFSYGSEALSRESDQSRRQRLVEERHREYNQFLEQQKQRGAKTDSGQTGQARSQAAPPSRQGSFSADRAASREKREPQFDQQYVQSAGLRRPNQATQEVFQALSPRQVLSQPRDRGGQAAVQDYSERGVWREARRPAQSRGLLDDERWLEPRREVPYSGGLEEKSQRQPDAPYRDRNRDLPPKPPTPGGFLGRLGRDKEEEKRKLREERQRELNQHLTNNDYRSRRRPEDDDSYLKKFPGFALDTDSAKYILQLVQDLEVMKQRLIAALPPGLFESGEVWSSTSSLGSGAPEVWPLFNRKIKERNEEYNQFLREKEERERHRYDHRKPTNAVPQEKPDSGIYATLPGLKYSNSAQRRKSIERNRDYNEYLHQKEVNDLLGWEARHPTPADKPPTAPRQGWNTPTYEDVLARKRREEAQYRRYDDPELARGNLKSYGSEGALNRLEDEKRIRDLYREADSKRIRYLETPRRESILSDPNWLSPRSRLRYESDYYNTETLESAPPTPTGPPQARDREAVMPPSERPEPRIEWVLPPKKPTETYATLPIGEFRKVKIPVIEDLDGREERGSAQARQKQQYRQELEQQMRQAEENKRREKEQGWMVDGSGYYKVADPVPLEVLVTRSPRTVVQLPPPPAKSSLRTRFIEDFDKLSARSEAILARSRPSTDVGLAKLDDSASRLAALEKGRRSRTGGGDPGPSGILDTGFGPLLDPPRVSLAPPPGLEYTPSSYITGGNNAGGGSSIDEAYRYFGMTNPLEADPAVGGGGGADLRLNLQDLDKGRGGGPTSNRVKFNDRVESLRRDEGPAGGLVFPSDAERKSKVDKNSYQEELRRQMEEKRLKKLREKEDQERYDRKIEYEAKFYDPFGKGGGGAPLKDSQGQVITDLRRMRKDNNDPDSARRFPPNDPYAPTPSFGGGGGGPYGGGGGGSYGGGAPSYRDNYLSPRYGGAGSPTKGVTQTNAEGEPTYARGGHGIFGVAKTDEEKAASDKYKDELRRQIEEKKRLKDVERQKVLEEEARENKKLEEQRRIMQYEYEEEQRKIKAKEEEAKRQNEELIRLAEERKRELESKKRDADEQSRREREREEREREQAERSRRQTQSPPVPTLQHKKEAASVEDEPLSGKETPLEAESPQLKVLPKKPMSSPLVKKPPTHPPVDRSYSLGYIPKGAPDGGDIPKGAPDGGDLPGARGASPPVPAVRHRESGQNSRPASRKNSVPRAGSADVLNQLAHFRRQLQSERQRVETMLDESKREQEALEQQRGSLVDIDTDQLGPDSIIRTKSVVLGDSARDKYTDRTEPRTQTRTLLRNEPDIFDPRLVQRPPPAPVARQELDIFETAMNRGAVPVRRAPTTDHANPSALAEFHSLKNQEDSDSRRQFREQYPGDPNSGGDLEAQQAALIRQQEQRLRAIREGRGQIEPVAGPSRDLGLNREPTLSPQPMLESKSAFIGYYNGWESPDRRNKKKHRHRDPYYNGFGSFPDDFEDLPRRNDSARARRRERNPSTPSIPPARTRDPLGSDTSLNVDRISRKNEERLKRLKELQGDDVSLYDPDDVIDRFMAKQAHKRPPSRHTLQDDTWLNAGDASKGSFY